MFEIEIFYKPGALSSFAYKDIRSRWVLALLELTCSGPSEHVYHGDFLRVEYRFCLYNTIHDRCHDIRYSNLCPGGRVVAVERGGERAVGVASKLDGWFLCVSRQGRRFQLKRILVQGGEMDWGLCEQSKKACNRHGHSFSRFIQHNNKRHNSAHGCRCHQNRTRFRRLCDTVVLSRGRARPIGVWR